jgi:type IV secretory pathway VirB2 component (pilin)
MLMTTISAASAASAVPPTDSEDTSTFDKILEPVWKIYSFIKYIATAVAAIFMVIAGIIYMTAGNDMMKRDSAKHTITYVIVGLIVIWAAPFVVQLFA